MSFDEIDLQWFAAEDEGRTEEASEHKISEARKEGCVAKSPEISAALVLLCAVVTLMIMAGSMWNWFKEILIYYFARVNATNLTEGAFFMPFLNCMLKMVLPLCAVGIVAAVAANIVQNRGFLFTTKPITPQFSKIAPKIGQYLKKTLFSKEGAFNVIKSIVKVAVIVFVAYYVIKKNLPVILKFIETSSISLAVTKIASVVGQLLIIYAIIFLVISIPDYLMQRHQFLESLKMTKQEVKQEYKDMEGDPEVKSKLNQFKKQLLARDVVRAVKESDVVITNPTHYAVALKYDTAIGLPAPQVTAKGEDEEALRIRSIAKENDIPIVENRPLARGLFANVDVGDIIPEDYFKVVATVYSKILSKK